MTSKCKWCGVPIKWVKQASGKWRAFTPGNKPHVCDQYFKAHPRKCVACGHVVTFKQLPSGKHVPEPHDNEHGEPCQGYREYLESEKWKKKTTAVKEEAGRCQWCGTTDGPFETHHEDYLELNGQGKTRLLVLCHLCHAIADKCREMRNHGLPTR